MQELVNFPRPELPEDLQDALLRASQESESIPDPVPNPSLPEHMKPRANQLKSKQGRQKIPLHRYVSRYCAPVSCLADKPVVCGDILSLSQLLFATGRDDFVAARSARLQ